MKVLKLIVVGLLLLFAITTEAQISVNINLGTPPQWGPAGYSNVQYYYLPDVEAYYDVPSSMFIYSNGVTWVHRTYLPSKYRNYDLYSGYKVVMTDYHGKTPYIHFKEYKAKYAKGYRGTPQKNYGEKPDSKNSNHNYNNSQKGNDKQGSSKNKNSDKGHGKSKKKK